MAICSKISPKFRRNPSKKVVDQAPVQHLYSDEHRVHGPVAPPPSFRLDQTSLSNTRQFTHRGTICMKIRALALRKRLLNLLGAGVLSIACGALISASASPGLTPSVFSVSSSSTRAVVLESVSMRNEPFSLNSEGNFNPADPRTRITLFGTNLEFLQGEGASALTADAEDAAHTLYPLKVEYVGTVPNFDGIYMVVLRLNDLMTGNLGDVLVRLNLHGMASNRVRVAIGQIGGGPADDNPGVGTPAPATPPVTTTPQTIAEYRA